MAQTAPPTVTAAPAAPSRTTPSTFAALADAFLGWVAVFAGQVVALGANVYANALDAYANALAAAASAVAALASQNAAAASASAAAASAGAAQWVSGTTYVIGDVRWSPITRYTYRRITAGAGTTDPSADAANWALAGAAAPQLVVSTTTANTMLANQHLVLTNVAASTATLPLAPAVGDSCWVTVGNGLATNVVARNGKPIMGQAEDLTIDDANATVALRYVDATLGWRIV